MLKSSTRPSRLAFSTLVVLTCLGALMGHQADALACMCPGAPPVLLWPATNATDAPLTERLLFRTSRGEGFGDIEITADGLPIQIAAFESVSSGGDDICSADYLFVDLEAPLPANSAIVVTKTFRNHAPLSDQFTTGSATPPAQGPVSFPPLFTFEYAPPLDGDTCSLEQTRSWFQFDVSAVDPELPLAFVLSREGELLRRDFIFDKRIPLELSFSGDFALHECNTLTIETIFGEVVMEERFCAADKCIKDNVEVLREIGGRNFWDTIAKGSCIDPANPAPLLIAQNAEPSDGEPKDEGVEGCSTAPSSAPSGPWWVLGLGLAVVWRRRTDQSNRRQR